MYTTRYTYIYYVINNLIIEIAEKINKYCFVLDIVNLRRIGEYVSIPDT